MSIVSVNSSNVLAKPLNWAEFVGAVGIRTDDAKHMRVIDNLTTGDTLEDAGVVSQALADVERILWTSDNQVIVNWREFYQRYFEDALEGIRWLQPSGEISVALKPSWDDLSSTSNAVLADAEKLIVQTLNGPRLVESLSKMVDRITKGASVKLSPEMESFDTIYPKKIRLEDKTFNILLNNLDWKSRDQKLSLLVKLFELDIDNLQKPIKILCSSNYIITVNVDGSIILENMSENNLREKYLDEGGEFRNLPVYYVDYTPPADEAEAAA